MHKISLFFSIIVIQITTAFSNPDGAIIRGHVLSDGEHLPYMNVVIKGTTIGTITDESGHFKLEEAPFGKITVIASGIGYKAKEITVSTQKGKSIELHFNLEVDALGIEELVVSADRNEKRSSESPVIVNSISSNMFTITQSNILSESLNFTPGLRTENNCQNCGFNQIRMNGLDGPYSQILINNRPIFSGLAGVYGLELIPASMIERVEVVRGSGSALYGSNAIAGTINLILKDPLKNDFGLDINRSLAGFSAGNDMQVAPENTASFNSTIVSDNRKTGMALYAFHRDKEPFDANGDGFSELAQMKNTTFGTRLFHRFGQRSKLSADFFTIQEKRRGGDRFDYPLHEARIAEAVEHYIMSGAVTFDKFFREVDKLSLYLSAQKVNRDSYYGALQSLADYGKTGDLTWNAGAQYKANFDNSSAVMGIESVSGKLQDKKLGYPDLNSAIINDDTITSIPHTETRLISNQQKTIYGTFVQYEYEFERLIASAGARFDQYRIMNLTDANPDHEKHGIVLSPRFTLLYDVFNNLQFRASYSKGYRAPQIFDEDLHIETSGSRRVIHKNAGDLTQETSHSVMTSLDFTLQKRGISTRFLAEAFFTRLLDPFMNEIGEMDEKGNVVYTRINAENGATVKGLNFEMNFIPGPNMNIQSGFTLQTSQYDEAQEFNEKHFFRSPDQYGYFTINWSAGKKSGLSATGNYTGKMLVPYFGPKLENPEAGILNISDPFFDFGLKLYQNIALNDITLQFYGGVKNLFNAYQNDFDTGINRDPAYIYGPGLPRTLYFGIKLGKGKIL